TPLLTATVVSEVINSENTPASANRAGGRRGHADPRQPGCDGPARHSGIRPQRRINRADGVSDGPEHANRYVHSARPRPLSIQVQRPSAPDDGKPYGCNSGGAREG